MLKKGSSSKKKIIQSFAETPNKSHAASIHLKTSQDLYSEIYRLPLKQILQQRKQQQNHHQISHSKSKNFSKLESTVNIRTPRLDKRQSIGRSSKKISICHGQQSIRNLKTDRSTKDFILKRERTSELKRLNTCQDEIKNQQTYFKMIEDLGQQNRRLKQQLKRKKKDCIQIKIDDLFKLVHEYVNVRNKNEQLYNELNFYKNETQSQEKNYVLKSLK